MITFWPVSPFSDKPVGPDTIPALKTATYFSRKLLAPGEVTSASFCVRADKAQHVYPIVSNVPDCLTVQIRHVLRWVQNRSLDYGIHDPGLVSEVLANDPALVHVEGDQNFLDDPLIDADKLKPLSLLANTTYQFWITIRVDRQAKPCNCRFRIMLVGVSPPVDVPVEILPFTLVQDPFTRGVYYHGVLGVDKSDEQYEAEMCSLVGHGITHPMVCEDANVPFGPNPGPTARLERAIAIRRRAGVTVDPLILGRSSFPFLTVEEVHRRIPVIKAWAQTLGINYLTVFAHDEPGPSEVQADRPIVDVCRQYGVNVMCALNRQGESALDNPRLSTALLNTDGEYMLPAWHAKHVPCWRYGPTSPECWPDKWFRRFYGFEAYRMGFNGIFPFACNWPPGPSLVNELESDWKYHMLFLPGAVGPLDTIQYEALMQAFWDTLYAATLRTLGGIVPSEEGWDLDVVRTEIINRILEKI